MERSTFLEYVACNTDMQALTLTLTLTLTLILTLTLTLTLTSSPWSHGGVLRPEDKSPFLPSRKGVVRTPSPAAHHPYG